MAMLYPGCSLTSASAAPRTRWSPAPVTAHAQPAAHHPHSWEHLCAGLQGHRRQTRAVFKLPWSIPMQRSTEGTLRSQAGAGLGGLAPTTPGMTPTPVSATLTLCSSWWDSTHDCPTCTIWERTALSHTFTSVSCSGISFLFHLLLNFPVQETPQTQDQKFWNWYKNSGNTTV